MKFYRIFGNLAAIWQEGKKDQPPKNDSWIGKLSQRGSSFFEAGRFTFLCCDASNKVRSTLGKVEHVESALLALEHSYTNVETCQK